MLDKLKNRKTKVGVVGMGYVGLPLALSLAEVGFEVIGVDIDETKIKALQKGLLTFAKREPGLGELLTKIHRKGNCVFTKDYKKLVDADAAVITVQTPLMKNRLRPDYRVLLKAVKTASTVLSGGSLFVVQSTIAPGTSRELILPLLSKDIFYAYVPERVVPGKMLATLKGLPRIIGADDKISTLAAKHLYRPITEGVIDEVDVATAEITKTAENSYRFMDINFANALAMVCEENGVSYQDVRRLANRRDNIHLLQPGAGIGGHCIPKDPWLLVWKSKSRHLKNLFKQGKLINSSMPEHLAELVKRGLAGAGIPARKAVVAVLGYSYREGSDDIRETPAEASVSYLKKNNIRFVVHDPLVPQFQGDLAKVLRGKDAAVVLTAHEEYRKLRPETIKKLLRTPLVIDGRQTWEAGAMRKAGITFLQIGERVKENEKRIN